MSEWQPIETAPKDGTWVLAFTPGPHPEDRIQTMRWFEYRPQHFYWQNSIDHNSPDDDWPTHWMVLPEPPATTNKG